MTPPNFLPLFPSFSLLPNPLAALPAVINHLLKDEPWARAQLAPHAGKAVEFALPPFNLRLAVLADGTVALADPQGVPAVTIAMAFSALPAIVSSGPQAAMRQVKLTGDADFAQAVSHVAQNLRWEPEEDLSRVVGDVAAHRIVAQAKSAARSVKDGQDRLAENVAEYLLDEQPQLVRPRVVEEFGRAVATLKDDLARLEKRIGKLERR